MTSKTAIIAFICAATLMGYLPKAVAAEKLPADRIECKESNANESEGDSDEGQEMPDSQEVAFIKVHLDSKGNADEVIISRIKTSSEDAINLTLNKENSTITHEILTREPDAYDISQVETIIATNKSGASIRLNLNDHKYAGWPGSSFTITLDGKKISTEEQGHMVQCDGHFRIDIGSPGDDLDDELLK